MGFRRISHTAKRNKLASDKRQRRDSEAVAIRNSARWQKLRALVLREEPLCRDPYGEHALSGRHEPAAEVHHIVPLTVNPSFGYVRSNLAALCIDCHRRVDADNRAGKPTAHLFEPIEFEPVAALKIDQEGGGGNLNEEIAHTDTRIALKKRGVFSNCKL